jgi:hypothetical protein
VECIVCHFIPNRCLGRIIVPKRSSRWHRSDLAVLALFDPYFAAPCGLSERVARGEMDFIDQGLAGFVTRAGCYT